MDIGFRQTLFDDAILHKNRQKPGAGTLNVV